MIIDGSLKYGCCFFLYVKIFSFEIFHIYIEKKNTGSHGDNGSQGKHPVSFDIFDTLFQSVPDCTRPHDILPLSRHL